MIKLLTHSSLFLGLSSLAMSAFANVDIFSSATSVTGIGTSSTDYFADDRAVSNSFDLTLADNQGTAAGLAFGANVNIDGNSIFLTPMQGGQINDGLEIDITVNSFLQPGTVISGVSLGGNNLFNVPSTPALSFTDNTISIDFTNSTNQYQANLTSSTEIIFTTIPEPSSAIFAMLGIAGSLFYRKRA